MCVCGWVGGWMAECTVHVHVVHIQINVLCTVYTILKHMTNTATASPVRQLVIASCGNTTGKLF